MKAVRDLTRKADQSLATRLNQHKNSLNPSIPLNLLIRNNSLTSNHKLTRKKTSKLKVTKMAVGKGKTSREGRDKKGAVLEKVPKTLKKP